MKAYVVYGILQAFWLSNEIGTFAAYVRNDYKVT